MMKQNTIPNSLLQSGIKFSVGVAAHALQGKHSCECVFVPRPGAQAEDDGVVLVQHMGADGRSSLVVIDAQSWQELGRARLPYGLPCGFAKLAGAWTSAAALWVAYRFHGAFMPEKQSDEHS
eukprot:1136593-Pelagomonas_calceolata.AAC.1